jgi:hypothetical protein
MSFHMYWELWNLFPNNASSMYISHDLPIKQENLTRNKENKKQKYSVAFSEARDTIGVL